MKKNVLKILVTMISLLLIISIGTQVNAANNKYTCDLSINGGKNELNPEETAVFEIKVSNINAETGIIMFNAQINYDEDAFDCKISAYDDSWSETGMIGNFITLTRTDLSPNAEDQTIAKVELTAKPEAKGGKQNITFTDINFVMDNNNSFDISDKSVSLNILADTDENEDVDEEITDDYDEEDIELVDDEEDIYEDVKDNSKKISGFHIAIGIAGVLIVIAVLIETVVRRKRRKNY